MLAQYSTQRTSRNFQSYIKLVSLALKRLPERFNSYRTPLIVAFIDSNDVSPASSHTMHTKGDPHATSLLVLRLLLTGTIHDRL